MKRKLYILIIIALLLLLSGCHFETKTNTDDETAKEDTDDTPSSPQFTILDETDASLYIKDIDLSTNNTHWIERSIQYPKSVSTVNKEILCATRWKFNPLLSDVIELIFYVDDEFLIGTYIDGPSIRGKYEIINDHEVRLYEIDYNGLDNYFNPEQKEIMISFQPESDNLFYSDQLIIDETTNVYFGATGGESINDRIYALDELKVIKNVSKRITTERLMFRTGPDTSYTSIRISYGDTLETSDGTLSNFLKATELDIWARTVNKQIIGEHEDYWYYVSYKPFNQSVFGWVYGAFTETYQDTNIEQYATIFNKELETINGPQ